MEAISASGSVDFVLVLSEKLTQKKADELTWDQTFKVEKAEGSGVMKDFPAALKEMDGLKMQSIGPSTGDVTKIRAGGMEIASKGTSNVVFSPKPVRLGDTWPAKIESNGQLYEIRYELVGLRKEKDKDIAEIRGKFADGQAIKTLQPMKVLIDRSDGKLIVATSEFEVAMGSIRMKASYSVTRF